MSDLIPREMYQVRNSDYKPPKNFKFLRGQDVFRKGKYPKRRLEVLGYQDDKVWLNDMSYEEEKNLVLAENFEESFDQAG